MSTILTATEITVRYNDRAVLDAAEVAIRAAVSAVTVIYLEPDLDRALTAGP